MHKQGAKLARAATIRPGDKVKFGGRGPWPRVLDVRPAGAKVRVETKRGEAFLKRDEFVRVIRDA